MINNLGNRMTVSWYATPHDFNTRYKVIVNNKTTKEGLFAEMKTMAPMSYVPCNGWNTNKLFLLSNVIAHNLTCELPRKRPKYDSDASGVMEVQQNWHVTQTDRSTSWPFDTPSRNPDPVNVEQFGSGRINPELSVFVASTASSLMAEFMQHPGMISPRCSIFHQT